MLAMCFMGCSVAHSLTSFPGAQIGYGSLQDGGKRHEAGVVPVAFKGRVSKTWVLPRWRYSLQHRSNYQGFPIMTAEEAQALFWRYADSVTALYENDADVPELEPDLLKLLQLVKEHVEHTVLFKQLFIELGTSTTHCSWVLLYCMRDLRWVEVKDAINGWFHAQGGRNSVPRRMNYVSDVNWVYHDSPWGKADFFLYYWEREHPGEPWPCA
ncbi:hypothetical protein PHLH8_23450 [Pseudomonas sp. Pc102]|uniref:hypothetical protein n=1 Tax=Pseudomonas sp. Pc102 TaxID=2678261 RepID=UPI001BD1180E|nr:hypothetical protein [Pseudomonas sp. Pc102]BBP82703.1 hypothetical protein PHLH8_23450 [Pseudomonas sp. Pc102]